MNSQKDDRLRKLLQRVELYKPSASFTEEVMKEVQTDVVFNPLLKSILSNSPVEGPSENFAYGVMDKLEVSDFKRADQSIISKKVWFIVSGLWTLLVLIALFGPQENKPPVSSYFNAFKDSLHPILTYLDAIPSISMMCLISISGLLVLDFFLKGKFSKFREVS